MPIKLLLLDLRCFFFFLLAVGLVFSSPISDAVFESHGLTGRTLLQLRQNCPVDFENLNYTGIKTQCKGPEYTPEHCCPAFKQLACPYSVELNDLSNDCSTTLFSYLNLNGRYPPGLFASLCRDGKEGLDCSKVQVQAQKNSQANTPNEALALGDHSPVALLSAGFLATLLLLFNVL